MAAKALLWFGALSSWASAPLLLLVARLTGTVQDESSPELAATLWAAHVLMFSSFGASLVLAVALWRAGFLRPLAQAFFALIASCALWLAASVQTELIELSYRPHHGAYIAMGLALVAAPIAAAISAGLAGWVGRKAAMPFWLSAVGIAAGLFAVVNIIIMLTGLDQLRVWMGVLAPILFVWWIGAGWFMARLTFTPRNP